MSPSNSDFPDSSICSNEALPFEQNNITYSERHDAPRQAHAGMSTMQYTTANSSQNQNFHINNTRSLTSRDSATQLGHQLHETLPITRQALAQHDIIYASTDADKGTKYSVDQIYGPGADRAYIFGERAGIQDEHHAIQEDYFGLHEHFCISATHITNHPPVTLLSIDYLRPPTKTGLNDYQHPYLMTIYEACVNDQSRQVNFGPEQRVVVKHMQAQDWTSTSDNFHGIGAQFEFLNL